MTISSFGLYVHVPFCSRKCPYCDFNTYAVSSVPEEEYVAALLRELRYSSESTHFKGKRIHSIFWGGGTPSLFSERGIAQIVEKADELFGIVPDAEVTLEANPAIAQGDLYAGYRTAGVNRISLGAQSFSKQTLTLLGREHSPEQIASAVHAAILAGISNVSIDIIFGVPGQTIEDVKSDIVSAVSLPIKHLSTYSLTIEKGTPFFQRQERGLLVMPDEELVAEMLEIIPPLLASRGYSRYEISNYAQIGFESFHNRSYWDAKEYLGLGAGAHSYALTPDGCLGSRWSNCALPADYMARTKRGDAKAWSEELRHEMLQFEFFFLGLRKIEGVSLAGYTERFGTHARNCVEPVLNELIAEGFLFQIGNTIRLSEKGILVADSVIERISIHAQTETSVRDCRN
jgi:oxygen-independent coproporphyrinogen-3 oxidase